MLETRQVMSVGAAVQHGVDSVGIMLRTWTWYRSELGHLRSQQQQARKDLNISALAAPEA